MHTASSSAAMGGHAAPRTGPLSRIGEGLGNARDWLDRHGRKAWITATVLGFITVWPAGLGLGAYMLMTGRFSRSAYPDHAAKSRFKGETQMFCRRSSHRNTFRSSGNTAFDAYKADTLKRLEDEQEAFEGFLQRLREAKDKQEFDRFMDERATTAAETATTPASTDEPARGAY
nr:DUF2852 domain-containing protein [Gemmobacter serpentinus]